MAAETTQTAWQLLSGWIAGNHIGDFASIAGVFVSIIGFVLTIVGVVKSKSAAQRAEQAARETRESMRLLDTVVDFTAAISTLEEIKRMHRQKSWPLLPERYAMLRKLLISVRSSGEALTDRQSAIIQNALVNLRVIEGQVERSLGNVEGLRPAKFNALISEDIDNLLTVLNELKSSSVGG